jgi:hypothetical protein
MTEQIQIEDMKRGMYMIVLTVPKKNDMLFPLSTVHIASIDGSLLTCVLVSNHNSNPRARVVDASLYGFKVASEAHAETVFGPHYTPYVPEPKPDPIPCLIPPGTRVQAPCGAATVVTWEEYAVEHPTDYATLTNTGIDPWVAYRYDDGTLSMTCRTLVEIIPDPVTYTQAECDAIWDKKATELQAQVAELDAAVTAMKMDNTGYQIRAKDAAILMRRAASMLDG